MKTSIIVVATLVAILGAVWFFTGRPAVEIIDNPAPVTQTPIAPAEPPMSNIPPPNTSPEGEGQ